MPPDFAFSPIPDCSSLNHQRPWPQGTYGHQPASQLASHCVLPYRISSAHPQANQTRNISTMSQMTPAELEEFQNMSDRYQAELPGPLITEKLSIAALVTEYAQADPQFVVKTTALAQTHSAYRAVKGDGQCGWRASVFAYFELLQQLGDVSLVQQEIVRLRSFEDTMRMAGIDYDIIIDMFDFTWELLEDIRKAVERQDKNQNVILATMNDEIKSNSIVYHFKMMTGAYMLLHADQYEPFLEMTIYEYRVARIDPSNQEIDQIGLQALTDAIISPAGFALEVLYLDRSTGEEVTPYQFSQNGSAAPAIRLLYRPGHYDLIYRDSQQSIQVYLQNSQTIQNQIEPANQPTPTSDLYSYLFPDAAAPPSANSAGSYSLTPVDETDHRQSQFYLYESNHYLPSQLEYVNIADNNITYPPRMQHMYASSRSATQTPPPNSLTSSLPKEPQIRLNVNMFNLQRHETAPIDSSYLSAATNPAHFLNADFQPYMWNADDEYQTR